MPKLEFVIEASTEAAKDAVQRFAKEVDGAGARVANTGKQFRVAGLSLTDLKSGFDLAGQALAKLKQGWDFAKEGAQIQLTEQRFARLAQSIGTTGEALTGQLKAATKGMLSDAALMQTATDLLSLGLAKSSDQVVRLSRVSSALNMDMNQLVLTLANQTTMRFDQLGVSVDGFDKRLEALKKTGRSVNEAFTEAFLQQAEEQISRVGEAVDTTAGKMQKFEARLSNLGDNLKKTAADALTPILDEGAQLALIYDDNARASDRLAAANQRLGRLGIMQVTDQVYRLMPELIRLNEIEKASAMTADEARLRQQAKAKTVADTARLTRSAGDDLVAVIVAEEAAMKKAAGAAELHAAAMAANRERLAEIESAARTTKTAFYDLAAQLNNDKTTVQDYASAALKGLQKQLADGAITSDQYAYAARAAGLATGIMSKESIAGADALNKVNQAYARGLITPEQYAAAVQKIPQAAKDGVATLDELGIKLGDKLKQSKQDVLDSTGNAVGDTVSKMSTAISTAMTSMATATSVAKSTAITAIDDILAKWAEVPAEVRTNYIITRTGTIPGQGESATPGRRFGGPVDDGLYNLHSGEMVITDAQRRGQVPLPSSVIPGTKSVTNNVSGDTIIVNNPMAAALLMERRRLERQQLLRYA